MIRTILFNPRSGEFRTGSRELLDSWTADSALTLWVDFSGEDRSEERRLLRDSFGIDELALDDCQRERHPPKIEWFDGYYFLLLKGFTAETDSIDFDIVHISFFVGTNFIATRHTAESPSVNRIWELAQQGQLDMGKGPSHVCYRVVRTIIDRYTPIVLGLEVRLDELEEQMLDRPTDSLLSELIYYNTRLKKLRRIYRYQEAVLAQLTKAESPLIPARARHEFIDSHEQMERLASLSAMLQELTVELIEGYISLSSHRLNGIMKILTITAAIFLPLTLLAGVYGMNFQNMPELNSPNGYYVVLGAMAGLAAGLLALFRFMKWI